jgi:peptidoglycan/LPS O-acetylase OafA/YrhL
MEVQRSLNGLRGIASFIVVIYHGMGAYGSGIWYGYGVGQNFGIHQLPLVRVLFDGSSMVFLFYIVSGYLLALKPLIYIKRGDWDRAFQALSSSAFRRPLRLFLPALLTTFAVALLHWVGFFEYAGSRSRTRNGERLTRFELPAPRLHSLSGQLIDWFRESVIMVNPFTWDRRYNPYNAHLWTLSPELRASYISFVVVLGTARLTAKARLSVLIFIVWLCARGQKWEVATTLSGMALADLRSEDMVIKNRSTQQEEHKDGKQNQSRQKLYYILLLGLYLASYPKLQGEETPGFRMLTALTPPGIAPSKWWKSTGSWLLVWSATSNAPEACRIFTSRTAQYLGTISLGIYMLHGPLFHSAGLFLMTNSWRYTGHDTALQKTMSFALAGLILVPLLFASAEIFRWAVDKPCSGFTYWLESRLLSPIVKQKSL